MASASNAAVKRLLHDFREVLENPLPNVVALPKDDDLFVWHGNVRDADGVLDGVPIHFLIVFSKEYPSKAPFLQLFSRVPHPNVVQVHRANRRVDSRACWKLAMWDCIEGQDSWCAAYTVHSILVQLQAFLVDDELLWATNKVSHDDAIAAALALMVEDVGHTGQSPWPAFPAEDQLQSGRRSLRKTAVTRPVIPPLSMATALALEVDVRKGKTASSGKVLLDASRHLVNAVAPGTYGMPQGMKQSQGQADADGWQTVASKGKAKQSSSPDVPVVSSVGSASNFKVAIASPCGPMVNVGASSSMGVTTNHVAEAMCSLQNPFEVLPEVIELSGDEEEEEEEQVPEKTNGHHNASPINAKGQKTETVGAAGVLFHLPLSHSLSKTAKKNKARSKKRSAKKLGAQAVKQSPAISTALVTSAPATQRPSSAQPAPGQQATEEAQDTSAGCAAAAHVAAGSMDAELIAQVYAELAGECEGNSRQSNAGGAVVEPNMPAGMGQAMGHLFGNLDPDTLLAILCLLEPRDVASLSSTCKGMYSACNDGAVWRCLLGRHFPRSSLSATCMSDWKHAYLLEANNVVGELRCFYTKDTFEQQVLGLPYRFSVNPVTHAVDYIEVDPELVSMEAVNKGLVRKGLTNEEVQGAIPVYLTAEHFNRALPLLPRVLRQLAPDQVAAGGKLPPASAWLDIIPKMMNTAAVLLCDRGVASSERSLNTYCALHRLLMAIVEHFNLWGEVWTRLELFAKAEKNRTKEACPNLGLLIPLLSLSPKHDWKKVCLQVVTESFDRSVMWICKHDPSLVPHFNKPAIVRCSPDNTLLAGAWDGAIVGRRILMFNIIFLRLVAAPHGVSLQQVMDGYDSLYGRPALALRHRFQRTVQRVLDVAKWDVFLDVIGLQRPSSAELTCWLRQSWHNSLRKRYHRRGMDFSKVQRSGVSKILLKGQQYSCPPNIKRISIEEHWKYTDGVKYLDASALLYDYKHKFIEAVDYSATASSATAEPGAVQHSGDILDYTENSGKHTIDIKLDKLGDHVSCIYLTMSTWAGAKLDEIKQPFISIVDPATGTSLCDYYLETLDAQVRSRCSCVIMCAIARDSAGRWKVEAIGHVGHGYARNYAPVQQDLKDRMAAKLQAGR